MWCLPWLVIDIVPFTFVVNPLNILCFKFIAFCFFLFIGLICSFILWETGESLCEYSKKDNK